jgi:hypothetical protein
MLRWLHHDAPGAELGEEFAAWVADGYGGVELRALQRIGTDTIFQLYRQSPVWMVIAPMEAKFRQFVDAFGAWEPDDSEDLPDDDISGSSENAVDVVGRGIGV